jgi:hypothetical protein
VKNASPTLGDSFLQNTFENQVYFYAQSQLSSLESSPFSFVDVNDRQKAIRYIGEQQSSRHFQPYFASGERNVSSQESQRKIRRVHNVIQNVHFWCIANTHVGFPISEFNPLVISHPLHSNAVFRGLGSHLGSLGLALDGSEGSASYNNAPNQEAGKYQP